MPKPFLPMTPTPPPRPPAEIVWAWKRGSGEFTPYDPETSARIEGAHAVGDKGVIIFLPAAYRIDFDKMCQINLGDESRRRSIVRLNALDATVEMPRRNSRTDGAVFDSPSKVRKALPFCSGSADMDMALLLSGGFDKQSAHRPEYTGATKSEAVPVGLSNKKNALQSVEAAKRAGSKQGLSTAVLRKPLDYDAYGPKPSNDHQLSHYVDVELANYVLKRIPGPIPSGKYMQPIADALADDNARWLKSHKNGPSTGQERTAVAEIIASYESGRRSVFSGHKAVKVREQAAWLVENKDELHPAYVKHFAEVLNNCYGEEGEKEAAGPAQAGKGGVLCRCHGADRTEDQEGWDARALRTQQGRCQCLMVLQAWPPRPRTRTRTRGPPRPPRPPRPAPRPPRPPRPAPRPPRPHADEEGWDARHALCSQQGRCQ